MAQITVTADYDLVGIAEAAGSTDPDARYYSEGVCYVDDVTQEDLDAALLAFDADAYALGSAQQQAKLIIDEAAERARLRYITGGAGQAMAYQEKGEEAADYIAAGYPADLSSYPFIEAETIATGKTATQAADDIIDQKSAWITVGSHIEKVRLGGKKDVDDAIDVCRIAE